MTKDTFIELLDDVVVDYIQELEEYYHHAFTFQHDNAPANDAECVVGREYATYKVPGWFEEVNIERLFHSGYSST